MRNEQLTIDHDKRTESGVYPILRGLDESVREMRDDLSDNRRETNGRLARMEEEITGLKREMTDVKISAGVTEHRLTELREDVKELRQEVNGLRGDLREMGGSFGMMQTRLNWWLVIVGIVIAALQYWKG